MVKNLNENKRNKKIVNRNKIYKKIYILYLLISKNRIINNYLNKIKKTYMLLLPADEVSTCVKTMITAIKAIIVSAIIGIVCTMFGNMHAYGYVIVIVMLVVVNYEIVNKNFENAELKLLIQLENYLSEVRHYYHQNGILEDAIYDSLENAQYEISLHINIIYDMLLSDEQEKTYTYKQMAPNRYFMTFFALCELVMHYGDTIKDDKSLFLENINSLRDEIRTQILKIQKIKHVFSGLTIICIVPSFTLKLIELWGESNIPELTSYYDGKYGLVVSILICLLSLISYMLISRLRGSYKYTVSEHKFLEKLISITFINNILVDFVFSNPKYVKETHDKLKRAAETISVKMYILRGWITGLTTFILSIITYIYFCMLPDVNGEKQSYALVLIPGILLISLLATKVQDVMLSVRMMFLRMNMEDEVLAFHSIIIMLMHIKQMDVETVLEWMENFANIFKASLAECVNSFSYDEDEALNKLEDDEPYQPFVRIVENLKSSDNVGIENAFEEIYTQRNYYMEKRKLDNEINISNKGAIGRVVSFVPMVSTIGLYLIIPFVLQSMEQLMGYASQMANM